MNRPTDYPVEAPSSDTPEEQTEGDYTLAMLSERLAAKKPVTDEMIRVARVKMESAHAKTTHTEVASQGKSKIDRIRKRFR